MISSDTPSEKNRISRSSDKLSKGSTARSGSRLPEGAATTADRSGARANAFDPLSHLVELEDPSRNETLGQRSAYRALHVGRHQHRTRIALSHQARRDVHTVAQEIAVRQHNYIAQVHANAQLGFALFRQRECRFDGEPNSSMKPSPAVLNTRPPCAAAMRSITLRSAATSAVVLASSASVLAE